MPDEPWPCFICGHPMETMRGTSLQWCDSCEVTEARDPGYINKTRTVTSQPWLPGTELLYYVNHALEHRPSPA